MKKNDTKVLNHIFYVGNMRNAKIQLLQVIIKICFFLRLTRRNLVKIQFYRVTSTSFYMLYIMSVSHIGVTLFVSSAMKNN